MVLVGISSNWEWVGLGCTYCQYQITIGRHRNQGADAESTELNLATVNHSAWWNIMWELSVAAAVAILFILTEVNDVLHDFNSLFCHWQHISFTLAQLLAKTKNNNNHENNRINQIKHAQQQCSFVYICFDRRENKSQQNTAVRAKCHKMEHAWATLMHYSFPE